MEWKEHYDKVQYTTRGVIDLFKDMELEFQPGTRFEYSSSAYNLLGAVIEEASGMPHEEYMKSQIWKPLGMESTQLDTRKIIPNRARGYDINDGVLMNSVHVNNSLWFAAGGGRSTVLDLIKYSKSLEEAGVLPRETQYKMFKPMTLADGTQTRYGMGWGIDSETGRTIISHAGGQPGTTTHLLHVLGLDFGLAIGCNRGYVDQIGEIAREIVRAFINEAV